MIARLALLAFLSVLVPHAAAGTLTVGPAGSGADHDSLVAAIAAAQPGDTVLVAAGKYLEPQGLVVDKPLTILGNGAGTIELQISVTGPAPTLLSVTGLATGERVRIVGLGLSRGLLEPARTILVDGCAGSVTLVGIEGIASSIFTADIGPIEIFGSSQVVLEDCNVPPVQTETDFAPPTPGLYVKDSQVQLNGCDLSGRTPLLPAFGPGPEYAGAPGLLAKNSVVHAVSSHFRGGLGTGPGLLQFPTTGTAGGAGIEAIRSEVFISDGWASSISGGSGAVGYVGSVPQVGLGAPGITYDGASQVLVASDAFLTPGLDSDGQLTAPPHSGAGSFSWTSLPLGGAEIWEHLPVPGGQFDLRLTGAPASTVLVYYSPSQGAPLALPGVTGAAWLNVAQAQPLAPMTMPGSGFMVITVAIPVDASLVGLRFLFQSLTVDPAGQGSVSPPTFLAIR